VQIQTIGAARTMSSLEIAELVESNHADVRRSIERIAERGVITLQPLAEVPNPGPGPKTIKVYQVSQRDSYVIVAQLSPEFTARLVDRWQELEARNTPVALPDFTDPVAAARAWADATEQKVKAEAALALAAPKVEFVDRYVAADTGSKGFRQVCKLLKANEARFREFLIGARIMYRLGGEWMAHQPHIDAGRFEVKTGEANSHAFNRCLFTPKGVEWVAGEWAKHQIRSEVTA
jgi:phage antirepressor YoqD-like protein